MRVLAIEIMSNSAGMLVVDGDKDTFSVNNLGKSISIPKNDNSIGGMLTFQTNFSDYLKSQNINKVVVCEGGKDSKKARVRMEFVILSECDKSGVEYDTYPTGSCTRLMNTTYKKETGRNFTDDLTQFGLPKYMGKALAAGWRFLS